MKKLSLIILVLCCIVLPLSAQRRGSDNVSGEVEVSDAQRTVTASGKQWAVFIAIDKYQERVPLLGPVKDAKEIMNILHDYYYIDEWRELYDNNATAANIRRLFIELQDKTAPNDSVFIFHAGHGYNDEKTKTSAWIPYNGGRDEIEQANWLSHLQIRSLLDSLKAKHVFLISDSCYSGDLLDARRGTPTAVGTYPAAYDKVSRQAMSSGASEEVSDESEFASRLKNTLLRTEAAYITPDYILSQITEVQTARQLYTIPILAAVPRSSHELGGSFLFFRKNPNPNVTERIDPAQEITPIAVVSPPVRIEDPLPVQAVPGEFGYFVGSWIATAEYNNSFDDYQINLTSNGRCTVKITSDNVEQETTGNWSWDGTFFKLNAVFRNAKITYQRNIEWISIVNFAAGNNSFNILAKPATAASNIRFTFFRDN
jgi:6-pyruvoyl-tetrahydropterin synthase